MTEDTIFEDDKSKEKVEDTVTAPVIPQELKELVGEGKKYSTVDQAIASISHREAHVAKLEAEAVEREKQIQKSTSLEEVLDEIRSQENKPDVTPQKVNVDHGELTQSVEAILKRNEAEKISKQNTATVVEAFTKKYGNDNAEEVYNAMAKEAGLSPADLNRLAQVSPLAVLKLAGLSDTPPPKATVSIPGGENTQTTPPKEKKVVGAQMASTNKKDVLDAWARAGEIVKERHANDP